MIGAILLILALQAIVPLEGNGLLNPAVRQSARGPPQWPETVSRHAGRCVKAAGPLNK